MKSKSGNSLRSVLAHIVLIILSFMCLFFFYILIINATRSHAELQKGFSALPGTHLLENLKNVANDGSFPMFRGIINSICISTACAVLCTYFSALTAYLTQKASVPTASTTARASANSARRDTFFICAPPSRWGAARRRRGPPARARQRRPPPYRALPAAA